METVTAHTLEIQSDCSYARRRARLSVLPYFILQPVKCLFLLVGVD